MSGYLYKNEIKINEKIAVRIPTVGYIIDHEDEYYSTVFSLTATPFDVMVMLDDAGIDFTTINDWDLFCMLFPKIQEKDTSCIFKGFDIKNMKPATKSGTNTIVFYDFDNDIVIDKRTFLLIGNALRFINNMKKTNKRPANEESKRYLLQLNREKLQRRRNKNNKSQIEDRIIAMVNRNEFPYDFDSVRNLSILQFNLSYEQICHKTVFDNTMIGCYAGTVKAKDLSPSQLSWVKERK